MSQYFLSNHIHGCCTGRYCVFLDLLADRYFSIPKDALLPIASLIRGWNITAIPSSGTSDAHSLNRSAVIEDLVSHAVLCTDSRMGRPAHTPDVPAATEEAPCLFDENCEREQSRKPVAAAIYAMCRAQWQLRFTPMHKIVSSILRRKLTGDSAPDRATLGSTLALTASFGRVRPLFPRNYLCLFDSLALIHYLARFRIYPHWVFGVREDPFFAHCWVQYGSTVLNDFHDRVATYTPIMLI